MGQSPLLMPADFSEKDDLPSGRELLLDGDPGHGPIITHLHNRVNKLPMIAA
jgi:hypothetical protein